MDIGDVVKIIDTTGLLNISYSVGAERENRLVLKQVGGHWLIYHFEKGQRDVFGDFQSEDEACRFYINKVANLIERSASFLRRMAESNNTSAPH